MGFQRRLLLTILLIVSVVSTFSVDRCAVDDEKCQDRRMHPDYFENGDLSPRALTGEENSEYWLEKAQAFVNQKVNNGKNINRAKNVIFFLGDGMGLTTIAAARNLLGGEHETLSFEKFPYTGLSKTYSVDKIVSDSACTATAYLCGVKANDGTIGVNANVLRGDCVTMTDVNNHVHSIAKWAMDSGKAAGVVTTTRITHASPAGNYAHIADRDWEDDSEVKAVCGDNSNVNDIAYQLIHGEVGSKLNIIMGGGRRHFTGTSAGGNRLDGQNLIEDFKNESPRNVYVETRSELMNINLALTDRILGLYQNSHMLYHLETNETTDQPTLEEMTRKAIEFLSGNENGYFIFIEGGRIDLAHHDTFARIALDETVEFSKAIQAARDMTNEDETLIVVTSDHSHTFSYSGYPYRGDNIFGQAPANPDDEKPYLTLSYANGPSFNNFYDDIKNERRNPLDILKEQLYDEFPSTYPLDSETHGGDDVGVFASGPWAHIFTGVYEQNTIPHLIGYASCIGNGQKMCSN